MRYDENLFKAGMQKLNSVKKEKLGIWPTPLQKLHRTEQATGYNGVYMKRDDVNGLGPGGNKVRSLEYLLYDAKAKGADTIMASGQTQSNLCTLAACAAAKLDMGTVLVHNSDKPEKMVGNALLNYLVGAECHYLGSGLDEYQRAEKVAELKEELKKQGKNPYVIINGASTGLGALGYIHVVEELVQQCLADKVNIEHLFVPGGNGGVAAGVVLGNYMLGSPFEVHVISVEYNHDDLKKEMRIMYDEIEDILEMPIDIDIDDLCDLQDAYMGEGWGKNTAESSAIVEQFPKWEGFFIENVYNSKVLVGMLDYIEKGKVSGEVCFLHTGGFGSLFAQY
jgi:1-aminocyclopropane-1-carboxylate deaminase